MSGSGTPNEGAPVSSPAMTPARRWRMWVLAGILVVQLAVLAVQLAVREPIVPEESSPIRIRELVAADRRQQYSPERDPRVGESARPLKVREGKRQLQLEAFRGRRVVIIFARGDEG
ncbi:MAG TPA: hypothetical protein VLH79_14765 [Chthonomonadales bacterium]|nr:hypothetical protein [Chthonomonadales bacterium]